MFNVYGEKGQDEPVARKLICYNCGSILDPNEFDEKGEKKPLTPYQAFFIHLALKEEHAICPNCSSIYAWHLD